MERNKERQNLNGVPLFIQGLVLGKREREGCSSERLGWEKRKVLVRDGSSKAAQQDTTPTAESELSPRVGGLEGGRSGASLPRTLCICGCSAVSAWAALGL